MSAFDYLRQPLREAVNVADELERDKLIRRLRRSRRQLEQLRVEAIASHEPAAGVAFYDVALALLDGKASLVDLQRAYFAANGIATHGPPPGGRRAVRAAGRTLPAAGLFHVRHTSFEIRDADQDRAARRSPATRPPENHAPVFQRGSNRRRAEGADALAVPSRVRSPAGIQGNPFDGPPGLVQERPLGDVVRDRPAGLVPRNATRGDVAMAVQPMRSTR